MSRNKTGTAKMRTLINDRRADQLEARKKRTLLTSLNLGPRSCWSDEKAGPMKLQSPLAYPTKVKTQNLDVRNSQPILSMQTSLSSSIRRSVFAFGVIAAFFFV